MISYSKAVMMATSWERDFIVADSSLEQMLVPGPLRLETDISQAFMYWLYGQSLEVDKREGSPPGTSWQRFCES